MARSNQIARQWAVIKTLDGRPKGITIAEFSSGMQYRRAKPAYLPLQTDFEFFTQLLTALERIFACNRS